MVPVVCLLASLLPLVASRPPPRGPASPPQPPFIIAGTRQACFEYDTKLVEEIRKCMSKNMVVEESILNGSMVDFDILETDWLKLQLLHGKFPDDLKLKGKILHTFRVLLAALYKTHWETSDIGNNSWNTVGPYSESNTNSFPGGQEITILEENRKLKTNKPLTVEAGLEYPTSTVEPSKEFQNANEINYEEAGSDREDVVLPPPTDTENGRTEPASVDPYGLKSDSKPYQRENKQDVDINYDNGETSSYELDLNSNKLETTSVRMLESSGSMINGVTNKATGEMMHMTTTAIAPLSNTDKNDYSKMDGGFDTATMPSPTLTDRHNLGTDIDESELIYPILTTTAEAPEEHSLFTTMSRDYREDTITYIQVASSPSSVDEEENPTETFTFASQYATTNPSDGTVSKAYDELTTQIPNKHMDEPVEYEIRNIITSPSDYGETVILESTPSIQENSNRLGNEKNEDNELFYTKTVPYKNTPSVDKKLTTDPATVITSMTTQEQITSPSEIVPNNASAMDTEPFTKSPLDTEPLTKSPLDTKPLTKSPLDTEPLTKSPLDTEPLTKSPLDTEPLTKSPLDTEPLTKSPLDTEPLTKSPLDTKPLTKSPLDTEPLTKSPLDTEPLTKSPLDTEPLTKSPLDTEPLTKSPLDTEPLTKSPLDTEPLTKPSDSQYSENREDQTAVTNESISTVDPLTTSTADSKNVHSNVMSSDYNEISSTSSVPATLFASGESQVYAKPSLNNSTGYFTEISSSDTSYSNKDEDSNDSPNTTVTVSRFKDFTFFSDTASPQDVNNHIEDLKYSKTVTPPIGTVTPEETGLNTHHEPYFVETSTTENSIQATNISSQPISEKESAQTAEVPDDAVKEGTVTNLLIIIPITPQSKIQDESSLDLGNASELRTLPSESTNTVVSRDLEVNTISTHAKDETNISEKAYPSSNYTTIIPPSYDRNQLLNFSHTFSIPLQEIQKGRRMNKLVNKLTIFSPNSEHKPAWRPSNQHGCLSDNGCVRVGSVSYHAQRRAPSSLVPAQEQSTGPDLDSVLWWHKMRALKRKHG